ncbi:hypothetical protein [Leptolyngbya sp. 7M]|uniref:hypothetical protein n=1 Tax=Leptolyngbya sp. 7M TaxID=2812896 RepID=UPI001B8D2FF1|nr:hypothetical protein [Leptolyngbya sp. 7M]QYO67503.1 hypothetical protein JVX88_12340 [Leptolyngbya sp. 7M]
MLSNSRIDPSLLAPIDAGLTKAFNIARAAPNNYLNVQTHTQFTVGLWPRSGKCINPGFLIRADGSPWDGTEFDKDPKPNKVLLCIAGIAGQYGANSGGDPTGTYGMLVVDDLSIMDTIIWFEAEHEILLGVDLNRWLATAGVHSHPIMGYGNEAAALRTASDLREAITFVAVDLPVAIDVSDGLLISKQKFCIALTK